MDPVDLEQLVDRELKALPTPRAPGTLMPRVLAATVQRPGGMPAATGWFTWPLWWRIASVAALAAVAIGLAWASLSPPQPVATAARTAGDTATVVRVFWEVLVQPIATWVFVVGIALALTCAAAWAALEFALGGATQR
jgi:hypothetical protein